MNSRSSSPWLRVAAVMLTLALAVPADMLAASAPPTPETVNWDMMSQIRNEGFRNSQVMEIEQQLTDVIGPRLTGSPNMKAANDWTRDKFTQWGLVNSHLEAYPFGRGWSNEYTAVRMVEPQATPLLAYPKAWTVSTNGVVRSPVVNVKLSTQADLDKNKGQLAGKIVLNGDTREVKPGDKPAIHRYDDKELADLAQYEIPGAKPRFSREEIAQRIAFQKTLNQYLMDEKVAAIIDPSRSGDNGLVFVQSGASYEPGNPAGVPSLVMAIENYGRITRLMEKKIPVELEIDVRNKFYDSDPNAYDTIAEIPGGDKKDEVVMLGAHLDSWHAGTGATDNAAGSAIVMEAVRILKALGFTPRRTIRVGLWSGEEQGLLGSAAYVKNHFGSFAPPTDPKELAMPEWLRKNDTKLTVKPEQAKVSAYFNVDNGTGKIRGIYLQENGAEDPIFTAWMAPFNDVGMTTVTDRNTGGTDHESFDAVGIPGFQFIQDPVEYMTRTHHSNQDVYERIQRDDMMQAAVILAAYVYDAAMRDNMLPRKPLPKPAATGAPATKP